MQKKWLKKFAFLIKLIKDKLTYFKEIFFLSQRPKNHLANINFIWIRTEKKIKIAKCLLKRPLEKNIWIALTKAALESGVKKQREFKKREASGKKYYLQDNLNSRKQRNLGSAENRLVNAYVHKQHPETCLVSNSWFDTAYKKYIRAKRKSQHNLLHINPVFKKSRGKNTKKWG